MSYAEDRVLVGVISRKRDLAAALTQHWYRIPEAHMKQGIQAEYIGFFLSRAFGDQNGSIRYFARITGYELHYRRLLLPDEPHHRNADQLYYKVVFDSLIEKHPPIVNNTKRTVTFIYTTWDRFSHARVIGDLYSRSEAFVDRIEHGLKNHHVQAAAMPAALIAQPAVTDRALIRTSAQMAEAPIYLAEDALATDVLKTASGRIQAETPDEIMAAAYDELYRRGTSH